MSHFKLLIDTNVFIGLEDPKRVDPRFAEIVRKCGEHGVGIFVHEAALRDIARDKDKNRQEVSRSKLRKFQQLKELKLPGRATLEAQFGSIRKANDEVDIALLHALSIDAIDFLVTEDQGIHDRVKLSPLARRVLTVADALGWLRRTFDPTLVSLPLVDEQKAYEIDINDEIFDSLREGYPDFDRWWREKCVPQHRPCWSVIIDDQLAGLIVRKDETHAEAKTTHSGSKILKICTFKVRPAFRGEKIGELLLKQVLWYAQKNHYDLVYITTFPQQNFLIQVLQYYGFQQTLTRSDGEMFFEKPILHTRLEAMKEVDCFTLARMNYPRFLADPPVRVFCVPIRGAYHQKLFPEIAIAKPLPLFPGKEFVRPIGYDRVPGNTIRKVYLCRAKAKMLKPGDVLLFYQSKTEGLRASQSLTSIGIVEAINETSDLEELIRLTAKRSVFSEQELKDLVYASEAPVRVIDFILVGHIDPPVPLADLISYGVFNQRPPQSISLLDPSRFEPVRKRLHLGFEV